jgi:hypothetical protein
MIINIFTSAKTKNILFNFVLEQLIEKDEEEVVDDDKYLLFHYYYKYLHDHLSVLVYYDDYFHYNN